MNLGAPKSNLQYLFYIYSLFKPTQTTNHPVLHPSAEAHSEHSQEFKLEFSARLVNRFRSLLLFWQKVLSKMFEGPWINL